MRHGGGAFLFRRLATLTRKKFIQPAKTENSAERLTLKKCLAQARAEQRRPERLLCARTMRSLLKKNDFLSQADEETSAAKPSRQLDNPLHASLRANDFPSASSSAPSTGSGQQRRPSLRSTAPPLVAATGRLALQPPDVHLALGRTPRGQSEELARESITSTVNACLGQAWEPSTQQTYNSTLSVNVGGAEILLGAELLPMDSDSKLMAAFASSSVSSADLK